MSANERKAFMKSAKLPGKFRLVYLLSFLIPVIILVLIYILRGIYPFGDQCFLRSDMYHQYAPFLAAFQEKLKTGGSLLYSWDIGMGVNFTALYAYYLATPINWILVLFSQKYLIELMSIILILKIGAAGFTFSYYICKRYRTHHPAIAAISVFYSLSAYICAYSWNVMWLDCIWLLPLILLGLERLIKEGKGILYCVSLGLCILSNYYISIMVCMFCVLYFILQMISQPHPWQGWWKKCLRFGLYSLIAGGIGACLLIPEFYALQLTVSGDINFPKKLTRYFSILEMISRQLMLVEPAVFSAHEPNIYSGMMVFLLVPLYAMNPKVNVREKAGKFVMLFLFYISFNLNIPNYIWHGFHFPNSLPCRQSFIFSFLILTMAYEGLRGIRRYTNKDIYSVLGGAVILFLIIEQIFANDKYSYGLVYISILFLCLYGLIAGLYRRRSLSGFTCLCLFFLLVIVEAFVNTEETSVNTTGRTSYVSDNQAITKVLSEAASTDDSFYRVEKLKRRTKNDSAWHHYQGVSLFSSTASAGLATFLGNLGGEESTNSYSYYGSTPFTESILSVKYVLSQEFLEDTALRELAAWEDSTYLYRNKYTLPIAFLIPENLNEDWSVTANNPFLVQNHFADLAADVSPLFTSIDHSITKNTIHIQVETDQQVYAYITSSGGEDYIATFSDVSGMESREALTFNGIKNLYIMDLGYCTAGTTITLTSSDSENIQAYIYGLNMSNFESFYSHLADQAMDVTSFDDTHITGTVTAKEDMTLFTSIIYEKGWTVKVDGVEVPITAFQDALVSIPIPAGTHEIEFSFIPYGLPLGILITLISISLLVVIILVKTRKKPAAASLPADEALSDNSIQLEED